MLLELKFLFNYLSYYFSLGNIIFKQLTMAKKTAKRVTSVKKQDSYHSQQQDDEQQTAGKKGRQDNSLSVLTKKFIHLIKNRQDLTIDLNEAVQELKVQKRRIYDITNVLQGINYVQKLQKNTIKWIGGNDDPQFQKDIDEMRTKYQKLIEQEKQIDQSIEEINRQIKTQFLENQDLRQYHYITYQDCLNICKAMNKLENDKSMVILSAPKGASLQATSRDEGCSLKMDSNGKGPIRVFTCQPKTGIKQLQPSRT